MATTGGGTSAPIPATGSPLVLSQWVDKWRRRLEDTGSAQLWTDQDLTDYLDNIQKQLCHEMPLIEDRSTASICEIPVVAGDEVISLSPRIVRIVRAKMASQTSLLQIQNLEYMDAYCSGWDMGTVTPGIPYILVTEGLGEDRAQIYPPLAAVSDTVKLVVFRIPLVDLDYSIHFNETLEIDKYAHLLTSAIMMQAYQKDDVDTLNPEKSEAQRILWEGRDGHGGDKERIRRMVLRSHMEPKCASPMMAFT